jgi:hypothetical protein
MSSDILITNDTGISSSRQAINGIMNSDLNTKGAPEEDSGA